MSTPKKINEGAVTALSGTDLVMACDSGGSYRPISLTSLMKAVRAEMDVSKASPITLSGGEWVRVAKTDGTFSAILSITHSWNSGKPVPLVCLVNGSNSADSAAYYAERLTKSSFYAPSDSSNQQLSFTALRYVREGSDVFVEVRFKPNSNPGNVYTSLAGQIGTIRLIPVTVSNASASNVLKTIEFTGGKPLSLNYLRRSLALRAERRAA